MEKSSLIECVILWIYIATAIKSIQDPETFTPKNQMELWEYIKVKALSPDPNENLPKDWQQNTSETFPIEYLVDPYTICFIIMTRQASA